MPLLVPSMLSQAWQTNVTAADRDGTTITASATANTKGAYSAGQLIAALDEPSYGLWVMVSNPGQAAAVALGYLLDIGIGPSGSEVDLIPNLNCGNASATDSSSQNGGKSWYFPIYIPDGERIAARAQSTTVSEAFEVAIWCEQDFVRPPYYVSAVTTYGAVTSGDSEGTTVAGGNGAFGSWVSIGTSAADHELWQLGVDFADNIALANADILIDVGIGPDSANITAIETNISFTTTANEAMNCVFQPFFAPVPSSTGLWARIAASAVDDFGVVLHGMD
jgi:hypothetical protein